MSVRIFHPSVAIFVQQAARAIHEAGQLDKFITTVRDNPSAAMQRLACAAGRAFGRDLRHQFGRRAITEVPPGLVETHPWGEILRLAAGSLNRGGRLTDLVWERAEKGFDRAVAAGLKPDLGGLYGYEHCSLASFERARELGIPVVYDVPAPESQFVHALLDAEMDRFPELRTAYYRHTSEREERRTARRRAEWRCADLIIAASAFTRDSYASGKLETARVRIVPYGAPPPLPAADRPPTNGPLNLMWAGTFSIRKGAHHLIEAFRQHRLGRLARLTVFGSIGLPDRVLRPLPAGVELRGSIPRTELLDQYRRADALVFPTLCDGFGMVVTEAWSRGVPVITTERAGAADLLRQGENGLLIRAGEVEAIANAIQWCADHRPELQAMRDASLATAAGWQWSDYRRKLGSELRGAGILKPS